MTESSWIANFEYNGMTESLAIDTKTGASYTYNGVPQSVADDMASADSLGRFHNQNLRGQFDCVKG
jgi:hypothetical protein